jgi:membrane-associated protease RseP (regulator of RpoE activity)
MSAKLLPLWMAIMAIAGSARADEPATKAGEAAPERIQRWIEQLDSDEYWTREEASKRLYQAGARAVEALAGAARSDKLEVSTRAVGVLSRLLELEDPTVELAAETALEEIAASRVTSAAARAESALDGYRGSRQDRVLTKLRQLGATITTQAPTGDIVTADITIGEGWRGTTADLASLKRLPSLQELHIYSESVNDDAVKHLLPLKQLTKLELFGTGISEDGFARLARSLASTTIDRRKGGLLGVMGDRLLNGGGCLVTTIQPGSAAEKAGLQPGDLIKKFEGQPVADFDSLTKLIATKGGGETVEIELERQTQVGDKIERQTLTKKAALDKWKNRPTLSTNFYQGDVEIIIGR